METGKKISAIFFVATIVLGFLIAKDRVLHPSSESKIESLVEGPIRDRLFTKGTKIRSVKILADAPLQVSPAMGMSYQHLWLIQVIADERNLFSGQVNRISNCMGISTNNEIDVVTTHSTNICPENISPEELVKMNAELERMALAFNETK